METFSQNLISAEMALEAIAVFERFSDHALKMKHR